ncbi:tyrosine-type recombinase/integrase [Kocuria palustris]|uniref:tyrosine-type recombinase/integrase n=1 Tax=Kocuria palustris TaxID=71999 RepID=UPI00344BB9BD
MKAKNGRGSKAITKWRWQLRVPVDPEQPDGPSKLVGKSGYATADDASEGLDTARQAHKAGQAAVTTKETVAAFSDVWLDSLNLAPSTMAGYRKIIRNQVVPQLGGRRLDTLTPSGIKAHYRQLRDHGGNGATKGGQGLSPNTVAKVHNVLSAMLDAAVIDGHLATNPARHPSVKAPRAQEIRGAQDEVTTWTAAELRAFLEWDRNVYQDDLHTLWLVIAQTGMRRSEAIALRWQDFDAGNQRLAVRRAADTATARAVKSTKTGSARVIDLSAEVVDALHAWKRLVAQISFEHAKAGAYILGNPSGELRSPNEVGRRWRRRVLAAQQVMPDLPTVTLKGLRHTHATLLLQAGVQPKVVQERLGHSTIAVTMNIYSHVMPSMQRDAVDRLSAIMGQ